MNEFVVHPVVAGHGPTLFAGLEEQLELDLVERHELRSGAVALRYQPRVELRVEGRRPRPIRTLADGLQKGLAPDAARRSGKDRR